MPETLRVTDYLPAETARNLRQATNFARRNLGRPLNVFVTAHIGLLDGSGGWRRRRQRLQTCIRRWLERRGERLTAAWVAEAPGRDIHLHMLVHVPTKAMRRELETYLRTNLAADAADEAFDVQPVNRRPRRNHSREPHAGVMDYLLKGQTQAQGRIRGKRAGVTQDISAAARRQALEASMTALQAA